MGSYDITYQNIINFFRFQESIMKNRKLKRMLLLTFSIMVTGSFLFLAFKGYTFILASILTISFFTLLTTGFLTSKFYTWPFLSFIIVILGIIFKRYHWPYSSILMTLGTVFLGLLSIYNSFKISNNFRENTFLKWFGDLTGLIVILFMSGLLFMNLRWNGTIREMLLLSGCFLFFFTVLAMVFTLPFSNYVAWTEIERKVFFRTILIPMTFIFVFFTLVFILPDLYASLTGRGLTHPPWPLYLSFEYFNLEGI
jgi:hypothetical protein